MKRKATLALVFAILFSAGTFAQQLAPFKQGDRVTFVGNSITDGGHYHSYIWLYYMTHFPMCQLWMANCGVGGDSGQEILNRLDGDVFAKNPTVLTLTFGMNDSGYFEYNGDNPEAFGNNRVGQARKNFLEIEKRLKGLDDVRIIMIGTSPYDQTSKFNDNVFKNKNNYMKQMIAFQDSAAKANNWEMLDFNSAMCEINEHYQQTDPNFTLCGSDRIHPDNDGHMVMAYLFLKAQGMSGKKVADIGINAKQKKATVADNCEITNVRNDGGVVSFDYLAKSLPYPLDTIAHGWGFSRAQAKVTESIPTFMEEMNMERLAVSGLKGNYVLTIDKEEIGTFSAKELAEGINLAEFRHTPQYQQAAAIMALNEDRWEIERRFRDYTWLQYDFFMKHGLLEANNEKAARVFREGQKTDGWVTARREIYDKMIHKEVRDMYIAQMDMIVKRIYEINKPVTRHIQISPVH
ncbi:MAG: SGNH/GDSL hydrolase family protein [Prevotella sp.]